MNLVTVKSNIVITSSRIVPQTFGKRHDHVIRDIEALISQTPKLGSDYFHQDSYQAGTGKSYKMYYMNRDGFSLLVMGLTGKKALERKIKFIHAFNEMEEALKRQHASAPAPVLRRVTYRGQVLMKATDLAALTGIPDATMLNWAKRQQLPRIVLKGSELRAFKAENHEPTTASRVALYPRDSVISLLTLQHIYDTFKSVILAYFPSPAPADGQLIDLRTAELDSRTKEKHLAYLDVSREFAADLFTNIGRLRMKVAALET